MLFEAESPIDEKKHVYKYIIGINKKWIKKIVL